MPPSSAGSSGRRRPAAPSSGTGDRDLDPALRQRLLSELRTPWRGLRRGLWLALTASAGLGLATMALRLSAGGEVASMDLVIQIGALSLCCLLLWFDRNREPAD